MSRTTPHVEPCHEVSISPGTLLHRLVGPRMQVNSSHHQAVQAPGRGWSTPWRRTG